MRILLPSAGYLLLPLGWLLLAQASVTAMPQGAGLASANITSARIASTAVPSASTLGGSAANKSERGPSPKTSRAGYLPSRVPRPWRRGTSLQHALEASRVDGKPVVAIFSSPQCNACRQLEEHTLRSEAVRRVASRFRWVWLDIARHPSLVREYGVSSTPTTVVLTPDGKSETKIVGDPGPELAAWLTGKEEATTDRDYPKTTFSAPNGFLAHSSCSNQVGYGPFNYRTQSPFLLFRQAFKAHTTSNLGRGRTEAAGRGTLANLFAFSDEEYLVDFETLQSGLELRHGLTDNVQLGLELDHRSRFGGNLDHLVTGFHDAFGVDQSGRDDVEENGFALAVDPGDGRAALLLDRGDRGGFARSLTFRVQHNLSCGLGVLPALAYGVSVRYKDLEFSDASPFAGDRIDVGLSAAVSKSWKRLVFYGTLGYAYHADERIGEIDLDNSQWSFTGTVEWRQSLGSWIFQYLLTEGALVDVGPFRRASQEILLGWKREIGSRLLLELALVENLAVSSNSPDFGVHAGFATRF